MTEWKEIRGDRLMMEHPDGFTVIRPKDEDPTIPLECPCCGLLMRVASDPDYYRKHTACSACSIKWAEGSNKEKWDAGWRPPAADVEELARIRSAAQFTPEL